MRHACLTSLPFAKLSGFYQIVTQIETVYDVVLLRDSMREMFVMMNALLSFGFTYIPFSCFGSTSSEFEILFWTWMPIMLFIAVVVSRLIRSWFLASSRPWVWSHASTELLKSAQSALKICFMTYPIVTSVACQAFLCHHFESGHGYLISNVEVECNTAQHRHLKRLAWAAIVMYPFGAFVLTATLLFRARTALRTNRPTATSRAIAFLHSEYKPESFAFELAEMARRVLFVGVFGVMPHPFSRGTMLQLAMACLVSVLYLTLQLQLKPYRHLSDYYLAVSCSLTLTTLLFSCIFYKFASLTELAGIQADMSLQQRHAFVIPVWPVTMTFAVSSFGALSFSVLLLLQQLMVERRRHLQIRRILYKENDGEAMIRADFMEGPEQLQKLLKKLHIEPSERKRSVLRHPFMNSVRLGLNSSFVLGGSVLPDGTTRRTGAPSVPEPGRSSVRTPLHTVGPFHIFLSHSWKHGQETMRVVKKALRETLPGVSVFLGETAGHTNTGARNEVLRSPACEHPIVPTQLR